MASDADPTITPPAPEAEEGLTPPDADELPTVVVDPAPPPPLGRSWAFDFGSESFVRSRGVPLETRGTQTLLGWIDKCLHTERGALPIHPPEYGVVDLRSIFGRPVDQLSAQELEERFREALTFHPRIADVTDLRLVVDETAGTGHAEFAVITDPPTEDAELRSVRTDLEVAS
jgi:hypothetical protein